MSRSLLKDLETHLDDFSRESPEKEGNLLHFVQWLQEKISPREFGPLSPPGVPSHIQRLSGKVREKLGKIDPKDW